MRNRIVALSIAAAGIGAFACGSDSTTPPVSKIINFTASMTPAGEVGANLNGSPSGNGSFTATLDTSTNVFTWSFTFAGLTSNVNNGHIHGPFVVGQTGNTAGVILNFNPASPPPGGTGLTFTGFGAANNGAGGGSIVLAGSTTIGNGVSGDSLRKLLLAGNAYVNIHTTSNPGGEIRAQVVRKP